MSHAEGKADSYRQLSTGYDHSVVPGLNGNLPPNWAGPSRARQGRLRGKGLRKARSSALDQIADIGVSRLSAMPLTLVLSIGYDLRKNMTETPLQTSVSDMPASERTGRQRGRACLLHDSLTEACCRTMP